MISRTFAAGLLILGLVSSAQAQTVPDDVRCLLLSNMFAKQGGNERGRQVAAQSLLFFAGRLDARANTQAVTAAMRAQRSAIDAKTASTGMSACAVRVQRAQQMLQAAGRAAAPPK
jgi:hypothetical protein